MASLNSRLQLALLNRKKGRNLLEKGFTLVELMIVIVIVGVLSATALPQFLGVKDKAQLAAEIGENAGLAKECSAAILINGPYPAAPCQTAPSTAGGAPTAPTAAVNYVSAAADANSAGVACGPDTSATNTPNNTVPSGSKCTISVDSDTGAITYTIGA